MSIVLDAYKHGAILDSNENDVASLKVILGRDKVSSEPDKLEKVLGEIDRMIHYKGRIAPLANINAFLLSESEKGGDLVKKMEKEDKVLERITTKIEDEENPWTDEQIEEFVASYGFVDTGSLIWRIENPDAKLEVIRNETTRKNFPK